MVAKSRTSSSFRYVSLTRSSVSSAGVFSASTFTPSGVLMPSRSSNYSGGVRPTRGGHKKTLTGPSQSSSATGNTSLYYASSWDELAPWVSYKGAHPAAFQNPGMGMSKLHPIPYPGFPIPAPIMPIFPGPIPLKSRKKSFKSTKKSKSSCCGKISFAQWLRRLLRRLRRLGRQSKSSSSHQRAKKPPKDQGSGNHKKVKRKEKKVKKHKSVIYGNGGSYYRWWEDDSSAFYGHENRLTANGSSARASKTNSGSRASLLSSSVSYFGSKKRLWFLDGFNPVPPPAPTLADNLADSLSSAAVRNAADGSSLRCLGRRTLFAHNRHLRRFLTHHDHWRGEDFEENNHASRRSSSSPSFEARESLRQGRPRAPGESEASVYASDSTAGCGYRVQSSAVAALEKRLQGGVVIATPPVANGSPVAGPRRSPVTRRPHVSKRPSFVRKTNEPLVCTCHLRFQDAASRVPVAPVLGGNRGTKPPVSIPPPPNRPLPPVPESHFVRLDTTTTTTTTRVSHSLSVQDDRSTTAQSYREPEHVVSHPHPEPEPQRSEEIIRKKHHHHHRDGRRSSVSSDVSRSSNTRERRANRVEGSRLQKTPSLRRAASEESFADPSKLGLRGQPSRRDSKRRSLGPRRDLRDLSIDTSGFTSLSLRNLAGRLHAYMNNWVSMDFDRAPKINGMNLPPPPPPPNLLRQISSAGHGGGLLMRAVSTGSIGGASTHSSNRTRLRRHESERRRCRRQRSLRSSKHSKISSQPSSSRNSKGDSEDGHWESVSQRQPGTSRSCHSSEDSSRRLGSCAARLDELITNLSDSLRNSQSSKRYSVRKVRVEHIQNSKQNALQLH